MTFLRVDNRPQYFFSVFPGIKLFISFPARKINYLRHEIREEREIDQRRPRHQFRTKTLKTHLTKYGCAMQKYFESTSARPSDNL